jgi:hypothetical protein
MSILFWVVVLSLWPFGRTDGADHGTPVPTAHASSAPLLHGGGNDVPSKPPPD